MNIVCILLKSCNCHLKKTKTKKHLSVSETHFPVTFELHSLTVPNEYQTTQLSTFHKIIFQKKQFQFNLLFCPKNINVLHHYVTQRCSSFHPKNK